MKSQVKQSHLANLTNKKWQKPKEIAPQHQVFIKKVGEKLKTIRTEKNLTVSEAAEHYGVSRSLYYQLENGTVYFTISTLLRVLDKLEISSIDFFRDL
jgi:DNA-binding XRE family transcriptional regulator